MSARAYSPQVQALFAQTPHGGSWEQSRVGVHTVMLGSPAIGQVLQLQLLLADDLIQDSRFLAFGCGATIAAGAWLCSWLQGRSLAQAQEFQVSELISSLGLPNEKLHCALLAQDALQALLQQLSSNSTEANHGNLPHRTSS